MFNNAIQIGPDRAVIVTFEENDVIRLTPNGFVETESITCFIYEAKGMLLIGSGDSLRAPEDEPDDEKGIKLAFERAVSQAFKYDREARIALFETFWAGVKKQRESEVDEVPVNQQESLEAELANVRELASIAVHSATRIADCQACQLYRRATEIEKELSIASL